MKVPGFSIKSNVPKPPTHPKAGIKTAKRQQKVNRPAPGADLIRKTYRQGDSSQTFARKVQRIINKTDTNDDHMMFL